MKDDSPLRGEGRGVRDGEVLSGEHCSEATMEHERVAIPKEL